MSKIYADYILDENESRRRHMRHVRCTINAFLRFDTFEPDLSIVNPVIRTISLHKPSDWLQQI